MGVSYTYHERYKKCENANLMKWETKLRLEMSQTTFSGISVCLASVLDRIG